MIDQLVKKAMLLPFREATTHQILSEIMGVQQDIFRFNHDDAKSHLYKITRAYEKQTWLSTVK